jgi:hypothetical protein
MNSLTKTTMKMNNKNNNSAVNAGPKGTLSKEMKEFAKNMVLLGLDEKDFEYLFNIKWEDRPKEFDDEVARIEKEYNDYCNLSIQVSEWMHTPTLSLFKEEDTIRKAYNDRLDKLGLDPITAQGSNDELLINLQLLLEDIGLAHAEQDAFEEYFDWEAWCKHHEDWEEEYQEIATELDFEEAQIEHIAECTPPIDVYVTIVEKER